MLEIKMDPSDDDFDALACWPPPRFWYRRLHHQYPFLTNEQSLNAFSAITSPRATVRKPSLSGVNGSRWADRPQAVLGHFLPFADALRETSNRRLHPSNRPFDWRKGTLLHRPIWPQCTHGRRRVRYGFLTDRASTQMIKLTDERRSSSTISRCATSRRPAAG
jgi:hypothetical protein